MQHISLYELNALVRETLSLSFDAPFWLTAELSEVRTGAGGHCYVEFVEHNSDGTGFVAKARGNIWRNVWALMRPMFRRATGRELAAGMKVLVQVYVTFHEAYGYSLNVCDIDPTYTLGDMARHRQEIIERLTREGVVADNKNLQLPRPLQRIAIISSPSAAGYGDFCDQLEKSGYCFHTQLFAAAMQGPQVAADIIAALNAIAAEADSWDAVAIVRGGGATSDLQGFENYDLANNVAQFPLPVITGIGHERDDTVIDFVAHTRLKTPTAVAAFLIDGMRRETEAVEQLAERLEKGCRTLLDRERTRFNANAQRLQLATTRYSHRQRELLTRLSIRLNMLAQQPVAQNRLRLDACRQRLTEATTRRFERERTRLQKAEAALRMAGPERILRLGFTLTLDEEGHVVRSAARTRHGQVLTTQFADGEVRSIVTAEKEKSSTTKKSDNTP